MAWIVTGIAALIIVWIAVTYNRLVHARNMVSEAWSGIDVQLKRRHELIPNIVETVKGYSAHERDLFERVTESRTRSLAAEAVSAKGEAENALSGQLKTLFAVAEAYPDLKANENFLGLQESLSEIEDQIQYARRYYNATVRDYNTRIQSFPDVIEAKLFGFDEADFFELEFATEREAPDVNIT